MSRSYRVKAKRHRVYSVADVLELKGICRNTLSNWVGEGLSPSPTAGPQVFRGSELNRFIEDRRKRNRKNLLKGQFLCTGCKSGVFPEIESVSIDERKTGGSMAKAACPDCSGLVVKLLGGTECDAMRACLNTKTALYKIHEEKGAKPAHIGKKTKIDVGLEPSPNDRVIHSWQLYAGRYDVKTVDAHLASIRDFEIFVDCKAFIEIRDRDAARYRNWLVKKGSQPKEEGGLSSSSIRHRVSHLKLFFVWLRKQDGYRRLSANILDQFDLPKSEQATILSRDAKEYPSLEEAILMVKSMPSTTLIARRDRAMVALAFLSAMRAGALVTLPLKNLDVEARTVIQDGSEMRAKNGKSFVIRWFPGLEIFAPFVIEWKAELEALDFEEEDALFPPENDLRKHRHSVKPIRPPKTNGPVNRAFAAASKGIGKSFSPHSARHLIKSLGDSLCTSYLERKAWSLNLGHENEVITETHYGKIPVEKRMRILEQVGKAVQTSSSWDEDKELMLRYLLGELPKGSPEYMRGKAMARQREDARDEMAVLE